MRNNWRASLVPEAVVIPAPIAYIKVVAVKKLVVELPQTHAVCLTARTVWVRVPWWCALMLLIRCIGEPLLLP